MNERIRELLKQAKEETDVLYAKLTPQEFKDTYNQKFAELIIMECAAQAEEESSWPYSSFGKKIKQHFGVKE